MNLGMNQTIWRRVFLLALFSLLIAIVEAGERYESAQVTVADPQEDAVKPSMRWLGLLSADLSEDEL